MDNEAAMTSTESCKDKLNSKSSSPVKDKSKINPLGKRTGEERMIKLTNEGEDFNDSAKKRVRFDPEVSG